MIRRQPSALVALAVALTACAPAAPPADRSPGPPADAVAPRVAIDLARPTLQLGTTEDFQSGTPAWGVDTERGVASGGLLSRTPVGAGDAVFPTALQRNFLLARSGHAAVQVAGLQLMVGGRRFGTATNDVLIFNPQTQVLQTAVRSLTAPRADHGAVAVDGRLYVIGGSTLGNPGLFADVDSVEMADVDPKTGQPGPFTVVQGLLPGGRADFAMAVVDGFVYLVGGIDATGTERDDILYAPILPDGQLGLFVSATATLPPPLGPVTGARATAVDGTVFVVGGQRKSSPLAQVFSFRPGPGGDVTLVEQNPVPLSRPRTRPAVAAAAGQVFVFGGEANAAFGGEAEVAQVARSGPRLVLPQFRETTGGGPIPEGAAAATDGISVYTSGGQSTSFGVSDELAAWRLAPSLLLSESAAAVRVGQWRRVLDLGRTVQLASVAVQGGAAEGGFARLSWRAATSATGWGPRSAPVVVLGSGAIPGPVPVSTPAAIVASSWIELVLDLDDDGSPSLPTTGVDVLDLVFAPTAVALVPPAAATSGDCSPVTLELRDAEGRPFPMAAALPVAVSLPINPGPVPATLHDGPLCESGLPGPVVVPAGTATATVWVKGGTVGVVQVLATPSDATIPAASELLTVTAGPLASLAFPAGSPPADVTSLAPFDVQVRLLDAAGNDASGGVLLSIDPATSVPGGTLAGPTVRSGATGLTTFAGLTLDRAGDYRLRASVPGGTTSTLSGVLHVAPGAPARLVFAPLPQGVVAGRPAAAPVLVDLVDAAGNVAANAPSTTVTLDVGSGPVGGAFPVPLTAATVAGRATFTGVTFPLAGSYSLRASATGIPTPALSAALQVSQVVIVVPPAGLEAGACTALSVDLRDGAGGPATAAADLQLSLAVQSGPGPTATTLHPTAGCDTPLAAPVTIAAGQGTRAFWARGGTAGALVLSATSPGAAEVTAATTVFAGPPAAITFPAAPPAQVAALGAFGFQVALRDAAGNLAAGTVAVGIAPADLPKGATLGGALTASTTGGVATFASLTLDKVATYALRVVVAGTVPPLAATTSAVTVVPGAPAQLVFATYPTAVVVGRAFDAPVQVELLDAAGNRCTNAPGTPVTLSLQGGAGGAVLGGILTQSTVTGVAGFPGLSISAQGTFQLAAASAGLASVSTGNVEVLPQGSSNPPVKLAWAVWPASVPLDTCSSEFRVEALDASDQRISPAPADHVTVFVAGSGPDATAVSVFSDPLCATPAASVEIGAAGVASFYVKGALTKVLTVAADATLSGNRRIIQKDFTVGSAPPPPPAPAAATPLNGWSCASSGGAGGGLGLAGLLAVALLSPRRRRRAGASAVGPGLGAGLGVGLVLALAAAPALAQTATPAGPPKPRATRSADVPLPPPPKGLPRTPTAEPAPTPPPVPAAPAAAPRKPRDPRPSVAVLNVEGTLSGERLDLAALTDVLATTVDQAGWFRVVSSRDVTAVLALERQKELLGCSADQACMAELAGALGVEYVLSASVGKVGEAYVISGRMVEAKRGTGVARASTNAGPAGLVRAVRATGRKLLVGWRAGRPEAEQARLALPERDEAEERDGTPAGVALRLAAVAGLAPGADEGARSSVGVEAGVGWRLGASWDLLVTGVGGPTFGGRVGVLRTLLEGGLRLSLGLRGVAWPGASAYGGGPVVELGLPLGRSAELVGYAAGEGYAARAGQGSFAVLGGVGISLRL